MVVQLAADWICAELTFAVLAMDLIHEIVLLVKFVYFLLTTSVIQLHV